MDFRIGGWLIGGRPKCLLIWGDHLFLNYILFFGQWWLINRAGFINPHLTFYMTYMTYKTILNPLQSYRPLFKKKNYSTQINKYIIYIYMCVCIYSTNSIKVRRVPIGWHPLRWLPPKDLKASTWRTWWCVFCPISPMPRVSTTCSMDWFKGQFWTGKPNS